MVELTSVPGFAINGRKAKYCSEFNYVGKIWHVHRPIADDDGWTFSYDGHIMWHCTNDLKPKAVADFCANVDALTAKLGVGGFDAEVKSLCCC